MEEKEIILTEEGYKKLEEQVAYLKGPKKMEVAARLKVAREYGDLSENSEYEEAKNEQSLLEAEIADKENMLRIARIVSSDETQANRVSVGATVKLYDYEFEEEIEYTLVGGAEADISAGKISNESPVGKSLIGSKKGQDVFVETPGGVVKYKVLSIKYN